MRSPSSSRTRSASSPAQLGAREPRLDLERSLAEALVARSRGRRARRSSCHSSARVVAHVARVAQPVGLLGVLADERVVADHDAVLRDARHLLHRGERRRRSDARRCGRRRRRSSRRRTGDARRARSTSGCMPGAGSTVTTFAPRLAQPPRDVAAAGRDVEHVHARGRLAPLDDEVEVVAGRVRRARRGTRSARSLQSVASSPPAPRPAARRRASSPRDGCSARRRRRGSAGPPRRSCRRAGRRSGTSTCRAGRAPRGSRARPRRSA